MRKNAFAVISLPLSTNAKNVSNSLYNELFPRCKINKTRFVKFSFLLRIKSFLLFLCCSTNSREHNLFFMASITALAWFWQKRSRYQIHSCLLFFLLFSSPFFSYDKVMVYGIICLILPYFIGLFTDIYYFFPLIQ